MHYNNHSLESHPRSSPSIGIYLRNFSLTARHPLVSTEIIERSSKIEVDEENIIREKAIKSYYRTAMHVQREYNKFCPPNTILSRPLKML